MSDIKTLKLTLKKKPIAPKANQDEPLEVSKRIGKKVVYQVNKKPETTVSVTKPKPPMPVVKTKKPVPVPKKEKKLTQPTPTQEEIIAYRKAKAEKAITWLIECYPKLFTSNEKKPLAIGIHKKIRLQNPATPRGLIAAGLDAWVETTEYCQAVLRGVGRYDLDSNLSGKITAKEVAHATKYLAKFERQKGKIK